MSTSAAAAARRRRRVSGAGGEESGAMGLGRQHALEHRRGAKRRLHLTNVGGLDSERLADVGKEALEVASKRQQRH